MLDTSINQTIDNSQSIESEINNIPDFVTAISDFITAIPDFITIIILVILSLDTLRAILAYFGRFNPNSRIGRIIYGSYDQTLLKRTFEELGFSETKQNKIVNNIKNIAKNEAKLTGVKSDDAAVALIILLAKYIIKSDGEPIQYGGVDISKSNYYINTMEIAHNSLDVEALTSIMIHLMNKKVSNFKKPDYIITPKGGNPLFAQEVSSRFSNTLVLAKSKNDKSRVTIPNNPTLSFLMNYEGMASTYFYDLDNNNKENRKCIIIDCNVSGGSQLIEIIEEMNKIIISNDKIKIDCPEYIFILFVVDDKKQSMNKQFEDRNCKLFRFFDLDEEIKAMLYELREDCKCENRIPELSNKSDYRYSKTTVSLLSFSWVVFMRRIFRKPNSARCTNQTASVIRSERTLGILPFFHAQSCVTAALGVFLFTGCLLHCRGPPTLRFDLTQPKIKTEEQK